MLQFRIRSSKFRVLLCTARIHLSSRIYRNMALSADFLFKGRHSQIRQQVDTVGIETTNK